MMKACVYDDKVSAVPLANDKEEDEQNNNDDVDNDYYDQQGGLLEIEVESEHDEEEALALTLLQSRCNRLDTIQEEGATDNFKSAAVTLVLAYCLLLAVAVGFIATVVARGVAIAPTKISPSLFMRKHKHP